MTTTILKTIFPKYFIKKESRRFRKLRKRIERLKERINRLKRLMEENGKFYKGDNE